MDPIHWVIFRVRRVVFKLIMFLALCQVSKTDTTKAKDIKKKSCTDKIMIWNAYSFHQFEMYVFHLLLGAHKNMPTIESYSFSYKKYIS